MNNLKFESRLRREIAGPRFRKPFCRPFLTRKLRQNRSPATALPDASSPPRISGRRLPSRQPVRVRQSAAASSR
ncbi:hypothetical protein L1987_22793 [Smallanthus sonchifolius]|uniref:Uncharacterized protein n=1 Tax=Smallanthus sonchifolius TaxID=185202 RepID=A0ACB9IHC0_9ASTR|nr:hypothetical protein L1987_22793 [Smallanthus sonchifolius]